MFELNHVMDVTSSLLLAHSPHFALTIFNCALHQHLSYLLPPNHNNHVRRRLQLPLCLPHHPPQRSCCGSRHPFGRSYRSPPGSSHSRSDLRDFIQSRWVWPSHGRVLRHHGRSQRWNLCHPHALPRQEHGQGVDMLFGW
jgi:hypothetical protein